MARKTGAGGKSGSYPAYSQGCEGAEALREGDGFL